MAPAEPPNARSALGINLSRTRPYATEQPFVDVLRTARRWRVHGQARLEQLQFEESGWPRALPPGVGVSLPVFPGIEQFMPDGLYVCLYEGRGTLEFPGFQVVQSGPGRIVLRPEPQSGSRGVHLRATDPADPVRRVRLILPGFEATHEAQPYHPDFLRRWERFSVLRFMNWMETNDSSIRTWSERPLPHQFQGTERGVALELMVDLANRLKAEPWFCLPHLADDEYVREFARLVKQRLDPGLRAWIEYSNEVWNGQFDQAKYARRRGAELGLAEERQQAKAGLRYTARRSVEIFRIFEEVFGGSARLVRVLPGQHSSPGRFRQLIEFEGAHEHADVYAVAPYFGGRLARKEGERLFAEGLGSLFAALREDLAVHAGLMHENVALAKEFGLGLVAYEGGQHLRGSPRREDIGEFLQAANRQPQMKELYLRHLANWKAAGGQTFVHYASMGKFGKSGSWGAIEYPNPAPGAAPKYEALLEFIAANPRWWSGPPRPGAPSISQAPMSMRALPSPSPSRGLTLLPPRGVAHRLR